MRLQKLKAFTASVAVVASSLPFIAVSTAPATAAATEAPHVGITQTDIEFILDQILIAEAHANRTRTQTGYTTSCLTAADIPAGRLALTYPFQVTQPWGLRQTDGRCNNIVPNQREWGAADTFFPRIMNSNNRYPAAPLTTDAEPRRISNLISDQTTNNPAAVAASIRNPFSIELGFTNPTTNVSGTQFELPNQSPDFNVSPPYNSWFTLFGQFFDHGLDLVPKANAGSVMVPLDADDPLYVLNGRTNFMVLTRAENVNGESINLTTPYVDQNQTYTSHPSHQVFLREYVMVNNRPYATGALLDGLDNGVTNHGLPTWKDIKDQARTKLGLSLTDYDVVNVPRVITDQYGKFTPAANGLAQFLSIANQRVSGTLINPVSTTNIQKTGHAFLDDIAHHAFPFKQDGTQKLPDVDSAIGLTGASATYYDNEQLEAHYIAGDGRSNENIGLTSVHHVFHSEHNLVMDDIKALVATLPNASTARLNQWQQTVSGQTIWNGERLFQAAKMVTEMEYQHLVFDEFARRIQPALAPFAGYNTTVNANITAEFAHAVYRFGHSMLNETVPRINEDGSSNDIGLIPAFLNPTELRNGGSAGFLTPDQGAGAVITGTTQQRGNEIDEFVTEALRNNLVGLPLDLATLNIARARETGTPKLNEFRRYLYANTLNTALRPYKSWHNFKTKLRHPESLVNFIAAYGEHPSLAAETTIAGKRAAATLLAAGNTLESYNFLHNTNTSAVGIEDIDLWMGGLAEAPAVGGLALLGTTFDYVFTTQLQRLQDGDRFYYLGRLAGTNLLSELEVGTFAAMVIRNSSAQHLPNPVFTAPDCTVESSALSFGEFGLANNAPAACAEILLLPDGTMAYDGMSNMVFGGTPEIDKLQAGLGDDTIWGDGGNDELEGGVGADQINGGSGSDILQDEDGDDLIKGGEGNDLINGGPGIDILHGGLGSDVILGGTGAKVIICGVGNDFVYGTDDADAIQGGENDDWLEGNGGPDLLTGNDGNPLENGVSGNDVLIGGAGGDAYDAEGGHDVMVGGDGTDSFTGALGFDWVTYSGATAGVTADMRLGVILPPLGVLVDTYFFVEGISGGAGNDVIMGDDTTALTLVGQELAQPNLVRGLNTLVRNQNNFAAGNILTGGAGSDTITGNGGNDIINGDQELKVYISVRSALDNTVEIARFDSLQALGESLFARTVSSTQLVPVRELVDTSDPLNDVDVAVYSAARANYSVTRVNGTADTWIVNHLLGGIDGTDTISGIERIQFLDQAVDLPRPPVIHTTAYSPSDIPVANEAITVNAFVQPIPAGPAIAYTWQYRNGQNLWLNVGTGRTFTPPRSLAGAPLRVVATYTDSFGQTVTNTSTPTQAVDPGVALPPNDPVTGSVVISDSSPTTSFALTVDTSAIDDANGVGALSYQWQSRTNTNGSQFADIVGADLDTFTPTAAQQGQILKVQVFFTDGLGYFELVESVETGVVGAFFAGTANVDRYTGTAGSDVINGQAGADTLSGGNGDDVINGGAAGDTLSGGAGIDWFEYQNGFGADLISDFDATIAGGQDYIDVRSLGITAANYSTNVSVALTGGRVVITLRNNGVIQGTIRLNNISQTAQIDITDFILA